MLAVVTGGDQSQREAYARDIGQFARLDLYALEQAWNIVGTPFAVAIDGEGQITTRGVVNSLDQLESLADALVTNGSRDDAHDVHPEQETDRPLQGSVPDLITVSAHPDLEGRP